MTLKSVTSIVDIKLIFVKISWGTSHTRPHNQIFVGSGPLNSHEIGTYVWMLPGTYPKTPREEDTVSFLRMDVEAFYHLLQMV